MSYASAIITADRLIKKYGRSNIALYRPTPNTSSDSSKPWKLDVDVSDTLLKNGLHVVFTDERKARGMQGQFGFEVSFRSWMDMPDSLIPDATSVAYLIPAELGNTLIKVGDFIVGIDYRYTVVRCDPLQLGDYTILYRVQLKE